MEFTGNQHEFVKVWNDISCKRCGFSAGNVSVHIQPFNIEPELRTIYYDNEGNSYSRETPHVFKMAFAGNHCLCGLDINDPVHTEGIDLSKPEPEEEFEEYVPTQHYYLGTDGLACSLCGQPYLSSRHIDSLGDALAQNSRAQQFKKLGAVPTYIPNDEVRPGQLTSPSGSQDQVENLTQIQPRFAKEGMTRRDKIFFSWLGGLTVLNATFSILNLVQM